MYGSVADSVGDLVGGNHQVNDIIQRMGGHSRLTDSFLASAMGLLGLLAAFCTVQAVLRLRGEETGSYAEAVLALPVGRLRWAASHLAHALLGPAALLALAGAVTGLAYGAATGDAAGQLARCTAAAVAQAPAVWVLTALTTLLVGLLPKASGAAWGLLGLFAALGELGPALRVPQPVMDLSPFTHLPKLPGISGGQVPAQPYLWLTAAAAAGLIAGLAGLRRRDLTS